MTLAIVDYGSGNLRSVEQALAHVAPSARQRAAVTLTSDPAVVAGAERIVLPGVGAFGACKDQLAAVSGMEEALTEAVRRRGTPFLGICVGLQLMAERGFEYGTHPGLGWLAGEVVALAPDSTACRIPHMGWNSLAFARPEHPILAGVPEGSHAYFVHAYHLQCHGAETVAATTEHGETVTAVAGRANMVGTQFHPEKSQAVGLHILANFWRWSP